MAPRACSDRAEGESLVDELKAQLAETLSRIDILTQERDEAREEVRRLRRAQYSQKKSSREVQPRAQRQEVLRSGLSDSRIHIATSSTRRDRSSFSHETASNARRRHSLCSTRTTASDSALQVTNTFIANPHDEPSSATTSSDTQDKGDEEIANNTTSRTQSFRKSVRFRCPSPQTVSAPPESSPTYEELQKRFEEVSLSSSGSKLSPNNNGMHVHSVETTCNRKHRSPKMKRRNSLGSTYDYFTNTNFTGRSSSDSATANRRTNRMQQRAESASSVQSTTNTPANTN